MHWQELVLGENWSHASSEVLKQCAQATGLSGSGAGLPVTSFHLHNNVNDQHPS